MSDHLDSEQLSRLIDGDSSLTSRSAARAHLKECPRCAQRHDALVAAAAALRQLPRVEWSSSQADRVVERLADRPARRRPGVLVGVVVGGAAILAGFVVALPLIGLGLALGHAVAVLASRFAPGLFASAAPQLVVIAAVAILAPLAAYPLARWR